MTAFRAAAEHVAKEAHAYGVRHGVLRKAEGDPDAFDEQQAATFLAGLDFAGLLALRDDFAEVLSDLALGGARQGMTTVRMLVPDAEDFALPSDGVQAWAADRAAWLVGKRVLEDGTVIDNPNAAYAIDETTREKLRGTIAQAFTPNADGEYQTFAELRDSIAQSYAFSEQRAALIARHEVGNALMQGNIETWKASGVVTSARWMLSDLHDKPDECDDLAGQLFPIDEIPELPHPACECDVIPEVEEEA